MINCITSTTSIYNNLGTRKQLSPILKSSLSRYHKINDNISAIKAAFQKLLKKQDQILEYMDKQEHRVKHKRHDNNHPDNTINQPSQHTKTTISDVSFLHTSYLFSPFLVTWQLSPTLSSYSPTLHNLNSSHENTHLFVSLYSTSVNNAQPFNLKGDDPHPPSRQPTELLGIAINSK